MTVTTDSFLPAGLNIDRYSARHIGWEVNGKVATITLNRPERKNPLTFDSYAELRDLFRALAYSKTSAIIFYIFKRFHRSKNKLKGFIHGIVRF